MPSNAKNTLPLAEYIVFLLLLRQYCCLLFRFFHLPTCPSVDDMAEHNKQHHHGTKEALLTEGYKTCRVCKP